MTRGLFACALLAASAAHAQRVTVPFVGCPSDGQGGPVKAPSGQPKKLETDPIVAAKLTYYSAVDSTSGVLAPRGWHCRNIYGSDGAFLVVTPLPMTTEEIIADLQSSGFTGPAVVRYFTEGFTSGRDEVAPVIQHLFPAHMRFARDAAAEMDQPMPRYLGPYRADKLHYLSPETVEFTTPANRNGTGTTNLHLKPDQNPISGVHLLVRENGDCCDLISVAVRLPGSDETLADLIRKEVEREGGPVESPPVSMR